MMRRGFRAGTCCRAGRSAGLQARGKRSASSRVCGAWVKKLCWHSKFGETAVEEPGTGATASPCGRSGTGRKSVRAGCSRPLRRAMADLARMRIPGRRRERRPRLPGGAQDLGRGAKAGAPAWRRCHRCLAARRAHLFHDEALAADLPIGSGEIESAHRTVAQQRLRRPGAWWKPEHAECMLALRVTRINGGWETYWSGLKARPDAASHNTRKAANARAA